MQFTYYGHSCFLLTTRGKSILFDPFISPNPLAKDIDIDQINCDYIAVSHAHEDHVADLVSIASRTGAKVIGSFELGAFLEENGITNFHPMNTGGGFDFDIGTVFMTNANHSNSYQGRYMGVAGGFVIDNEEDTFYYSGDTALSYDMKLVAHRFNVGTAALCIGGNFTMDYKDALIASDFVACKQIIGVHYDTFPPIVVDKDKAVSYFRNAGKRLHLPKIGETKEF